MFLNKSEQNIQTDVNYYDIGLVSFVIKIIRSKLCTEKKLLLYLSR